jgi:hypothetical protein
MKTAYLSSALSTKSFSIVRYLILSLFVSTRPILVSFSNLMLMLELVTVIDFVFW